MVLVKQEVNNRARWVYLDDGGSLNYLTRSDPSTLRFRSLNLTMKFSITVQINVS